MQVHPYYGIREKENDMGHPTADDEPNSFVPPGGLGPDPEPTIRIKLTDEQIVEAWVNTVRGAIAAGMDPDEEARFLPGALATALDIIGSLMERIHELEKR